MIRNVSISTFVNIIFTLAFLSTIVTFSMFARYDKQKHEISIQNRYELIAENILIVFQNNPTSEILSNLYEKFQISPIINHNTKLEIIQNAQELTIAQNYLGTYRVYKYNNIYYIYVQQYGYNVMLKDDANHAYSIAFIVLGFILSFLIFFILYEILVKKLKPLKHLNKQIIEFSKGNKNIKLNYVSNDEVGTIAKNFNEAIDIINNQSKSKELFMRNMMHELKTPITKAMFIAESLEDKKTKNNLQKAFKRMDDIIKELATVEKLTSKNTIIYKEKTSYLKIHARALEILMLNSKNIITNIDDDFDLEVDFYMMSIALKNLIDNAIKFSTDKFVQINANKFSIEIISKGAKLKNDLSFYTEAFFQEEKRSEGYGLGLYIVKTIVNLHKFKLEYKYENEKNYFIINIK